MSQKEFLSLMLFLELLIMRYLSACGIMRNFRSYRFVAIILVNKTNKAYDRRSTLVSHILCKWAFSPLWMLSKLTARMPSFSKGLLHFFKYILLTFSALVFLQLKKQRTCPSAVPSICIFFLNTLSSQGLPHEPQPHNSSHLILQIF